MLGTHSRDNKCLGQTPTPQDKYRHTFDISIQLTPKKRMDGADFTIARPCSQSEGEDVPFSRVLLSVRNLS